MKDVVDVILFMMEQRPESGLYNLGTGEARSFKDLVTATFSAMGVGSENLIYRHPGGYPRQVPVLHPGRGGKVAVGRIPESVH